MLKRDFIRSCCMFFRGVVVLAIAALASSSSFAMKIKGASCGPFYLTVPDASYSVCNLGIYVNKDRSVASERVAANVARAKAAELFLPNPTSFPDSWYDIGAKIANYDSNKLSMAAPYAYVSGPLYCGSNTDFWDFSYIACAVRDTCPADYEEINGQCYPKCGPGEVRLTDNSCACPPSGVVCQNKTYGPEECSGNGGLPGLGVGNPINVALGNKYQTEVDYVDPVTPELAVKRLYNNHSPNSEVSQFGSSWEWQLEYKFKDNIILFPQSSPLKARVSRPNGNQYYFTLQSFEDGSYHWEPEGATRDKLSGFHNWQYTTDVWTYQPAGTDIVESYSRGGRLLSIRYGNKTTLTFTYNLGKVVSGVPNQYLQEIRASNGRRLQFFYADLDPSPTVARYRLTRIVTPDNRELHYGYTSTGRLISVTYPDQSQRLYRYDEAGFIENNNISGALTGIEEKANVNDAATRRVASWYYLDDGTPQGKAYASEAGGGLERTSIVFNSDGSSTVTNPLGKQSTYFFDVRFGKPRITRIEGHPSENCAGANKEYTYYEEGTLQSKTDWSGNVTTYVRDSQGREISRTEAYDTPQARTILTEYHPTLNVPVKITEPGMVTEMIYDSAGRLLQTKKSVAEQP